MAKCIVKGCSEYSHQTDFIGNLCIPCYRMLTTGIIQKGSTFIHKLEAQVPKEAIMEPAVELEPQTPPDFSYEGMVKALAKPGDAIIASLTPDTAHLIHMAIGVSGEAGELLDAVKKAAIYCKPIDRANVVEELGDLEFYMEGLRERMGITREEVIQGNIDKLKKRYESLVYSDKAAQDRKDKA